ncbi:unnamed protein product [Spodoptera exigua]|nr:unnamed protein product [Spodoptera exigua]
MAGKLMPSSSHILSDSMLQYTLAPMYNGDYTDFMGVVVYEGREPKDDFKGSSSLGIMMANAMGGMWIGHTIPGFPNLTLDAAAFPPEELKNGHMIMCFSLGIETLNSLAIAIKQTGPAVTKIVVPQLLKSHLPEWTNLMTTDHPLRRRSKTSVRRTKILSFATRDKSLRGIIMARSPGDTRCVYQSFAKTKGIVVDVYGHKEHHGLEECDRKYRLEFYS